MALSSRLHSFVFILALVGGTSLGAGASKPSILLIDGDERHHDRRETTPVLKAILAPYFEVSVATVVDGQPFAPDFSGYDAVVSTFNDMIRAGLPEGRPWPEQTMDRFAGFVRSGGGLVVIHGANNSFPEWPEYNRMIGVGGWRGRTEKDGPYLRFRDGRVVRDTSPGRGGSHGFRHEFLVVARQPHHPILEGLPRWWMHARDELYDRLRGPAEQVEVLATAYSEISTGGTGEHEPMLMTVSFGEGLVFHTVLGHNTVAMSGLGFQITLLRGTEWAATGQVTIPASGADFLNDDYAVYRDPTGKEEGVWLSLFNGHTLKGWVQKNGRATYSVEKGVILGKTVEGSPNAFLCTRQDYADFELKFEVMLDDPLNSGVQIRSRSRVDYSNGRVHGPQVEIATGPEGSAGYVYSEATGRGWLSQDRSRQGVFKSGEWNQYRVRAKGPQIETWLNGLKIADLFDEDSFRSGFIGLQVHQVPQGSGPYEVRWRALFLRRLDQE